MYTMARATRPNKACARKRWEASTTPDSQSQTRELRGFNSSQVSSKGGACAQYKGAPSNFSTQAFLPSELSLSEFSLCETGAEVHETAIQQELDIEYGQIHNHYKTSNDYKRVICVLRMYKQRGAHVKLRIYQSGMPLHTTTVCGHSLSMGVFHPWP